MTKAVLRYGRGLMAAGVLAWWCGLGAPVVQAETPAQRCERETAQWNATQETLWRAVHPGQEPGPGAWPPYVCVGGPSVPDGGTQGNQPEAGTPPVVGDQPSGSQEESGHQRTHRWDDSSPPPGRVHHYEGFGPRESPYSQDMQLDGFRDTRSGGRYGGQGDPSGRPSGVSGPDSARSNVPRVAAWEVEIPRDQNEQDEATPQRVQVVADEQGRSLVVDDKGRATGEVVVIDPQDGRTSVIRDEGVVGRLFDIGEEHDESSPTTTSAVSAPDVRGDRSVRGESSPSEAVVSRGGDSPIDGMLGGVGAAVGAAAVVGRRMRRRDDAHRMDIDWGGGRRQSLVLLEGPESAREHVFDMDVPPGGRMVKNPDGSVDVMDAHGEVVEHVDAPWAFDAAGRRVPTWYEVGEGNQLVQVVDPERTTPLPVLADPDRRKSGAGGYKSGKTAGKKPERKKIKSIGAPPPGKGQGKPAKPTTPPAGKTQSVGKPLPPDAPRRKIKSIGAPPPSPAGEKNLLGKYPKQDPQNVCTPSPQSQQGKDLIKKYPAGSKPLPPDYSGVGKPLPPDAPRRKITAVGGPQPNPYEPLPEKKGLKGSGKSSVGKPLPPDAPRRKIKSIGAPPPPPPKDQGKVVEKTHEVVGVISTFGGDMQKSSHRADNVKEKVGGEKVYREVGKHRTPSSMEKAGKAISNSKALNRMGTAGTVISVAPEAVQVVTDSEHAGGHAGKVIGGVGGGVGGTYIGATIGALGGPFAPLTVPLGGAIGGYFGSKYGGQAGEYVGQKAQDKIL